MKLFAAFDRLRGKKRTSFSAAVYVRYHQHVLLLHHHRLGLWVPAGGSIEQNETPLQAAQRELFEETGIEASFPCLDRPRYISAVSGLFRYEELHDDPDKGIRMNFVFLADAKHNTVTVNDEVTGYRWVDADCDGMNNVPKNVQQNVRDILT